MGTPRIQPGILGELGDRGWNLDRNIASIYPAKSGTRHRSTPGRSKTAQKKVRHCRAKISPSARAGLSAHFSHDPYPGDDTILLLARELGLDVRPIRNWFSNTRSRTTPHNRKSQQRYHHVLTHSSAVMCSLENSTPVSTAIVYTSLTINKQLSLLDSHPNSSTPADAQRRH